MTETTEGDIQGASAAFEIPVIKVSGSTLCRCRWCDRNDVPLSDMAVYSFKVSFGGFTGVCRKCINSDEREVAYFKNE